MLGMLGTPCFNCAAKTCVYRYNRQLQRSRKKQGPLQPASAQAHMPADDVAGPPQPCEEECTSPADGETPVVHQDGAAVAESQGAQRQQECSAVGMFSVAPHIRSTMS